MNDELYYKCYFRLTDGQRVYVADFVKFADEVDDPYTCRIYKMIWNKNYFGYWIRIMGGFIRYAISNYPLFRREAVDFLRLVEYNEDYLEGVEIEYYADKMIEYAKKIVEEERSKLAHA